MNELDTNTEVKVLLEGAELIYDFFLLFGMQTVTNKLRAWFSYFPNHKNTPPFSKPEKSPHWDEYEDRVSFYLLSSSAKLSYWNY